MYQEIMNNINKLSAKIGDIQAQAASEGRKLMALEANMIGEMEQEIRNQRKELPANAPLTLQNGLGSHSTHSTGSTITAPSNKKDFRSMFGLGRSLNNGGFQSFNEYLEVLNSGKFDNRLIMNSSNITTPSEGGFSVPEEYAGWLLDSALEAEIVRPRAFVYPMKSATLKVPGWDSSSHTSTVFGGLVGTWIAEQAASTEVFAKMRQIELVTKKLGVFTSSSNELVQDGIDYDKQISTALIATISFYLDFAYLCGNGAGQPLGVTNDPALVSVTKETGQKSATITYENIIKMYSRLAPQCMQKAVFVASQTAIPQMLTLSVAIGTGGALAPALIQQNGQFTLLGKPVYFTEKLPALGTKGDIILADFSQYIIGMRKEVSLDRSIHVGFSQDTAAYRALVRTDGQGSWSGPITPKNGSTLSWCVALESRT